MRPLSLSLLPLLAALAVPAASQERDVSPPFTWSVQVEQFEYRLGQDDALAWDFDAQAGTDDLRFVWRSKAAYLVEDDGFEELENQARIETPVSTFFNLAGGVRVDTPEGEDRVYGLLGLHGLAPQWFEVDATAFLSTEGKPSLRLDAEYEALLTNRLTLRPGVEVDLPLADDEEIGAAAWGPTVEIGARLSYDLVDRAVSPYVGIGYERAFGDTADMLENEGEDAGQFYGTAGVRLLF